MYRVSVIFGQIMVFVAFFAIWEALVHIMHIKPVILPPPSRVAEVAYENRALLLKNTWPTAAHTALARSGTRRLPDGPAWTMPSMQKCRSASMTAR